MPRAIESMSIDELQKEFVDLGNQVSTIDGRRRAIDAEIHQRQRKAKATAAVNKMTPDERAALKDALK